MAKPIALKFKSAAKSEVEAWLTIESNLADAASALERLLPLVAKQHHGREIVNENAELVRSLYVYAVTWYLRCFASGRRARLSIDDVPSLSRTDRRTHEEMRTLRNHYFAHPVTNKHESTEVFLIVTPDKRMPLGFISFCVGLASDSPEGILRFQRLIKKVLMHARVRTRKLADRFAQYFFGVEASWDRSQYGSQRK